MLGYCHRIFFFGVILFSFMPMSAYAEKDAPALPLAHVYQEGVALEDYWLSEKLDGVRAYWDGKQLLSKQGNVYHAPDWFVADFPAQPLDGELWVGHDQFESLMGIVRDRVPGDGWRYVTYQVFDLPVQGVSFSERLARLKLLFSHVSSPYLNLIEQSRVENHQALMDHLDKVIASGGEGLMLHKGSAFYLPGRSQNLLKVKRYQDAEARVIGYSPGKGKYRGMLGALLVESKDNIRFRLGTGFTDQQRQVPPALGAWVTYKFYGLTARGIPKFASFVRVREHDGVMLNELIELIE